MEKETVTKRHGGGGPISLGLFLLIVVVVSVYVISQKNNLRVLESSGTPESVVDQKVVSDLSPTTTDTVRKNFSGEILLTYPPAYPSAGKAIVADLSKMKIYLLLDGVVTAEYPITAKGRVGSRYETPVGQYTITYKEKNHKVSVRDIYMPFSMHFFGNFFIHGKPIYGNGTELFDGPSGGCIRLSNDVAEKVYEFSERGTPVYITEDDGQSDNDFIKKVDSIVASHPAMGDSITAPAYVVSDLKTGVVLFQKGEREKYPIYSLAKLMTAVVADESFRDDRNIVIDPTINGQPVASTTVRPGETLTVTDILYPILYTHDDLSTYSMATNIGSGYYTNIMNEKARAIGMMDTVFADPAGTDEQSVSTPADLFVLSRYMYYKHPYLSRLTIQDYHSAPADSDHTAYTWTNSSTPVPADAKLFQKITSGGQTSAITVLPVQIFGETRLVSIVLIHSTATDNSEIESIVDAVKVTYK